jgi:hypothetical protein
MTSAHEYFYVEPLYCEGRGFHCGECQYCILLEGDSVYFGTKLSIFPSFAISEKARNLIMLVHL